MRKTAPLALLLATFLVIGTLYAIYTPDWQAPDEPAHYNYVRQLAEGSFPIIEPGDYDQNYQSLVISSLFDPQYSVESFEYEDYQPPLYYLLQTPVYQLSNGSLRALRLFSVLLGAGVVLLTYLVAQQIFPQRRWLAFTAAAFVAFLPQHVSIMASVNNDSLAELLIAGILLVLVSIGFREQREGERENEKRVSSRTLLFILGLLLGLGFLTKATVYIMVPVIGLVLAWKYWGDWREFAKALVIVFGLAALLGISWWIRNVVVYGGVDVLGTGAHNAIVVGQPRTAEWIAERGLTQTARAFLQTTFQSFWGQFGWMGVVMPAWIYGPLIIFSLLTTAGILAALALFLSRSGVRAARKDYLLPLLVLGGTFLLSLGVYLSYNVTFVQHQGRYLFSALVPIALGVSLAWSILLLPAWRRFPDYVFILPLGLAILLIGLDLLALFRFIVPSLTL